MINFSTSFFKLLKYFYWTKPMDVYELVKKGQYSNLEKMLKTAESKGVNISKQLNKQNYFGRT